MSKPKVMRWDKFCCPKCHSESVNLVAGIIEMIMRLIMRRRKYRCEACKRSFRRGDRRRISRKGSQARKIIRQTITPE